MGEIKKQGIVNTIITYLGIIVGAVNMIIVQPKLLSQEELGLSRLLYNSAYLIGLLVPLGLPNIIVKYFPLVKNKSNGHHGFAGFVLFVFSIGFGLIASLLYLLKPFVIHIYKTNSSLLTEYYLLIIPFTLIVSAITICTTYSQALFKSAVPSFLNDIGIRVSQIFITFLYGFGFVSFTGFIWSYIGIYLIELIILWGYIFIIDRPTFRFNSTLFRILPLKKIIPFGLILCMASFASYGLKTVDGIILGAKSLGWVGVYTTAVLIATFIEVPLGALERISHTKIADYFARKDYTSVNTVYKQSVSHLMVVGGLLFVGINACVEDFFLLFDLPKAYIDTVLVVYIVSFGALINVSTGVNSAIIYYSDHFIIGTIMLFLTLVVNVLLNLVLIPHFGIYGAAIASVLGSIIFNLTKYYYIYSKLRMQPFDSSSLKLMLIIIPIAVSVHFVPNTGKHIMDLIIKGGCVTLIYLILLWKLKLIPVQLKEVVLKRLNISK